MDQFKNTEMDGWTNSRTLRWIDQFKNTEMEEHRDGWTNSRTPRWMDQFKNTEMEEHRDGWSNSRTPKWMDQNTEMDGPIKEHRDGWTNSRTPRWMDGPIQEHRDGWTNSRTPRARRTCLDGHLSLLRRQIAAYAARLVYNISSPAERAPRAGGSVAAMIWLHFPFFWLSDIISNIRQSTIYTQQYYIYY